MTSVEEGIGKDKKEKRVADQVKVFERRKTFFYQKFITLIHMFQHLTASIRNMNFFSLLHQDMFHLFYNVYQIE